jgi:hypothetical protein
MSFYMVHREQGQPKKALFYVFARLFKITFTTNFFSFCRRLLITEQDSLGNCTGWR